MQLERNPGEEKIRMCKWRNSSFLNDLNFNEIIQKYNIYVSKSHRTSVNINIIDIKKKKRFHSIQRPPTPEATDQSVGQSAPSLAIGRIEGETTDTT